MKFKEYLREASKKDIIKRFKKLKKMSMTELEDICENDLTYSTESEIINVILFDEFRESDIELAFNNKEIK